MKKPTKKQGAVRESIGLTIIIWLITWYQKTLSPDHGPLKNILVRGVCRYYPSCSTYAIQAIHLHQWRGVGLALKRISRCHPFAPGGYDPVRSNHLSKKGTVK